MYLLNLMTPLLADDYFAIFVWPEGVRINGELPENAKRLTELSDFIVSTKSYYLTWGGRIPGSFPVGFFVWAGKEYFNFANAFMMTILVMEIYWLSHEGKVTFNFNLYYLLGIFFSLWTFNVSFIDTCLWLAGSCNYLWMVVVVLAFLIPYVRSYFNDNNIGCFYRKNNLLFPMFFFGVIAGWSHETTNCWLIVVLSYWLYAKRKHTGLHFWELSGYIGFCLGYALLIFAPGNFSRLQLQQKTSSIVIASELLEIKLVELAIILFFHFIIWYFIISFFFKYKRWQLLFKYKDNNLYLNISKAAIFVASASGLTMFLLPSNGFRPSFLNLVYLIIAITFLFRLQEQNGISFINNNGKRFLSCIGCVYLIITMAVSLWGNYINWCHWNNILECVKDAQAHSLKTILEVDPYPTSYNDIWLFGSGFHLVPMTITNDATYEFNKMFSKYYGIKGIRVRQRSVEQGKSKL